MTFRQVGYWVDSYKLFEHAVQVTDRNYFGYNHIGIAYDSDAKNITTMDANEAEELFDHLAKDFNRKSWRISTRGASAELLDHLPEDFHGPPKNLDKSLRHLLAYADSAEDFKEAARKLSLLQKQQLLFDYSADAFEATLISSPTTISAITTWEYTLPARAVRRTSGGREVLHQRLEVQPALCRRLQQ